MKLMIEIPFRGCGGTAAGEDSESLKEYVRALLSRQQALDLLESIQHQINEVWSVMRRLLDYTGPATRATPATRLARAAQAVQAQNSYRCLEKRREECIAALQHAERVANAALHAVLAKEPSKRANRKKPESRLASRTRFKAQKISRHGRSTVKKAILKSVLNPGTGIADAFIGN